VGGLDFSAIGGKRQRHGSALIGAALSNITLKRFSIQVILPGIDCELHSFFHPGN